MNSYRKKTIRKDGQKFLLIAIIVLVAIIILAGIYIYYCVSSRININKYRVENKYYGFELNTPKNWTARIKTANNENEIDQLINDCRNKNLNYVQEIASFRFQDQNYSKDIIDLTNDQGNLPTGGILEVTINCVPKEDLADYSFGDIKIAGENALKAIYNLFNLGETKCFSLMHNGLQYKINEYVYLSRADRADNSQRIKSGYSIVFDKIVSSFKFIK